MEKSRQRKSHDFPQGNTLYMGVASGARRLRGAFGRQHLRNAFRKPAKDFNAASHTTILINPSLFHEAHGEATKGYRVPQA